MAEIKGQILGIALVLAVFGAIAGVVVSMFEKTADTVGNKVDAQLSETITAKSQAQNDLGSLTF